MIKIELLELAGIKSALQAVRLPFDGKSKGVVEDMKLVTRLVHASDCEGKVARGIIVWLKITAPMDWWAEMETYRHGHERLSSSSKMHTIYRGLTGEALQKAREETPATYPLTKIDCFSYQCLKNIYKWRHNHRLPEWKEFCQFLDTLPYAKELIIAKNDGDND